jgi:N-acetylmuramoyl-L-alanine amidase
MVAEKDIAWHDNCFNTNTIGVEHEGFAAHPELWYTEAMYEASAKLTSHLADKYGIAARPDRRPRRSAGLQRSHPPGTGLGLGSGRQAGQAAGAGEYLANNITVDAPATLESGAVATVTITIANHGTSAWDLDATHIGTAAPQDHPSDLFVDGNWIAPHRPAAVDARTPAGGVGTFTIQIKGPVVTEPTVDDEAFQLVEEGSAWFGPERADPAGGDGDRHGTG